MAAKKKEKDLAVVRMEALEKELEATKKAKQENDERFMRERDEARAELAEHKEWATNELNIASAQATEDRLGHCLLQGCTEYHALKKELTGIQAVVGVLQEVQQERERQNAKWGIQDHRDGTCEGPGGAKVARQHADAAKSICNQFSKVKQVTWSHILTEELMEAYAETDATKLRTELIQVAAVATQWVECIDRRQRGRKG